MNEIGIETGIYQLNIKIISGGGVTLYNQYLINYDKDFPLCDFVSPQHLTEYKSDLILLEVQCDYDEISVMKSILLFYLMPKRKIKIKCIARKGSGKYHQIRSN